MIRNGLNSLAAVSLDGIVAEVVGILMLRDDQIAGGDSYVYFTGTYEFGDWSVLREPCDTPEIRHAITDGPTLRAVPP